MTEYYEILEVTQNASIEEIKKQYNSLYHYYHPDNLKTGSKEKFDFLNEAYNKLLSKINSENALKEKIPYITRKGLLDEYINYAIGKYGTPEMVKQYLDYYIAGHDNGITNDCGFRKKFIKYLSPNDIMSIVNGNLLDYIKHREYLLELIGDKISSVYQEYKEKGLPGLSKYLDEYAAHDREMEKYLDGLIPEEYARLLNELGYQSAPYVIDDLDLDYYYLKEQEMLKNEQRANSEDEQIGRKM